MEINPEDKMIKNGRIERVLREAFKDYLPESVFFGDRRNNFRWSWMSIDA